MMLSKDELSRLNEIELRLRAAEPRLDAALSTMKPRPRWLDRLAVFGWVAFAAVAVAGWSSLALILFGLLIPLSFSALLGDTAGATTADPVSKSPPGDPGGDAP